MPKAKRKSVSKSAPRPPRASRRSTASSSKTPAPTAKNRRLPTQAAGQEDATDPDDGPVFFWKETERGIGFLSPWYKCKFKESGAQYESVGHALMAEKARLFNDKETLEQIMAAKNADDHKLWGGNVKGVDETVWAENALIIATRANIAKFTSGGQSAALARRLEEFGSREFVLASPHDRLFGIGFGAAEAVQSERDQWGKNLFGQALDATRRYLNTSERLERAAYYDMKGWR